MTAVADWPWLPLTVAVPFEPAALLLAAAAAGLTCAGRAEPGADAAAAGVGFDAVDGWRRLAGRFFCSSLDDSSLESDELLSLPLSQSLPLPDESESDGRLLLKEQMRVVEADDLVAVRLDCTFELAAAAAGAEAETAAGFMLTSAFGRLEADC